MAVPVDLHQRVVDGPMEVLRDMGIESITFREAAHPPKPGAKPNIDQLREYSAINFADVRRFEFRVPDDMPLEWVRQMVRHALRDARVDVEPGDPLALE